MKKIFTIMLLPLLLFGIRDIKVSKNQIDIYNSQYPSENAFVDIRKNFHRINSITKWDKVVKIDDPNQALEGGEAIYYYKNGRLEKIISKLYGESGMELNEYYFLNKKISFVYEKTMDYNLPMYSEGFDINKSQYTEYRNYIRNEKLIHQLASDDDGTPWSSDYIDSTQKEILKKVHRLMKLKNGKAKK